MMELSIIWSILIAQIMLGLAMAFAFFRMVRARAPRTASLASTRSISTPC